MLLGTAAKVCIETVLAYRTKRGFREQPVVPEWQDKWGLERERGDLRGTSWWNSGEIPFKKLGYHIPPKKLE